MPAYNAQATLKKTYDDIPFGISDEIILVDDKSSDNTVKIARDLNINVICHEKNKGYGANQKTCYSEALKSNADIVVMLHPDYQYDPKIIPEIINKMIVDNLDCVIASRFLNNSAKYSKMPRYKYFSNRFLTIFQNFVLKRHLSEYHTGYRAFTKKVLQKMPFDLMNNDFVFDNEMLMLVCYFGYSIGEIPCECRYFDDASSINFFRSVKYGFGVLRVCFQYIILKFTKEFNGKEL